MEILFFLLLFVLLSDRQRGSTIPQVHQHSAGYYDRYYEYVKTMEKMKEEMREERHKSYQSWKKAKFSKWETADGQ